MNPETALKSSILLDCGALPGVRLFNNPVGQGWVGKPVDRSGGTVTLLGARPIKFGLCPGSSDIIGWQTVTITPDMLGQTIARFVAPEVKTTTGRASDEQRTFIRNVVKAGGVAGIVRSSDDLLALLKSRVLV